MPQHLRMSGSQVGSRAVLRLLSGLALLAGVSSPSDALAEPVEPGKLVTFEVRGEPVQGFLVRPASAGFHPGVVVVHEWWGLNDQIKSVAQRLARRGYVAIVPDLYRGKVGTDAGWAEELSRGLNESWALDVIGVAADWLRVTEARTVRRPRGQRMPVAVLGFSMGGRLSLAAALEGRDIQAAIVYYGGVETDPKALSGLRVPLLGIFAAEDRSIPREQVKTFQKALEAEGKDATIVIYNGVGQAFFNETRPNYHQDTAKLAWERTLQFLQEKLGASAAVVPEERRGPTAPPSSQVKASPPEG